MNAPDAPTRYSKLRERHEGNLGLEAQKPPCS